MPELPCYPPGVRVFCAWCLKEGKPDAEALIGEKQPPADDSHGICPAHRTDIEDRVMALRLDAERRRIEAEQQREEAERLHKLVDP